MCGVCAAEWWCAFAGWRGGGRGAEGMGITCVCGEIERVCVCVCVCVCVLRCEFKVMCGVCYCAVMCGAVRVLTD